MTTDPTTPVNTTSASATDAATTRQERLDHGLEVLGRIDGDAGEAVLAALSDISPELAHQVAAWGFGEIYARPGLPPRDRQLVTLGMLTALGGCEPQLRVHVNASLNVGLSPQEIVEALLHTAVYCGFPRALNATFAAKQVFAERGLLPVTPADPADPADLPDPAAAPTPGEGA
ncbi:carboxymuconolactone decarboxylase family protein [Kitasatospora phosalacinea]|uniref:carboxymuconolactone decarboxylase family protein n=1 Tax=Kitasatospora phosalacinea TaxID=2065 RepID=UPI0009DCE5AE|nr:carboxymuconolactone decarboxylase family protein [Kitasatospora phosalacinea]